MLYISLYTYCRDHKNNVKHKIGKLKQASYFHYFEYTILFLFYSFRNLCKMTSSLCSTNTLIHTRTHTFIKQPKKERNISTIRTQQIK